MYCNNAGLLIHSVAIFILTLFCVFLLSVHKPATRCSKIYQKD